MSLKRAGLVSTFRVVYFVRLQGNAGLLVVVEQVALDGCHLGGNDPSFLCRRCVRVVCWLDVCAQLKWVGLRMRDHMSLMKNPMELYDVLLSRWPPDSSLVPGGLYRYRCDEFGLMPIDDVVLFVGMFDDC